MTPLSTIPGPRALPIVGNAIEFSRDPLKYVVDLVATHGDFARFKVALDDWVVVNDPESIDRVLVREAKKYLKPKVNKRIFRIFLGEGLLSIDGERWRRQHKMIRPAFHRQRIENYGRVMVDYTHDLIDGWQAGERTDVSADMTAVTLRIVAQTLFDADVVSDAPTVGEAMVTINEVLCAHINKPIPVPRWWPSAANRKKIAAIEAVEAIVRRIIAERRSDGIDRGDLLSMLVFAQTEDGEGMTDRELRDEAMTLFFAGHETTAHALTWMCYLLARHPDVRDRLRAELREVVGDRRLQVSDLESLPYLDKVVKESMRLLPSVWTFMRETGEEVTLGPHTLPPGVAIFICPFITHRDSRWFADPERFDPERFTPDGEKAIPRGAYIPFSAGPRVCLGKAFAMMEARLVLGTLVQRADLELDEGYEPELLAELSLHPAGGLPMTVRPRPPERERAAVG